MKIKEQYWKFVEYAGKDKNGKSMALYICACGKQKTIRITAVKSEQTTSCGCKRIKHGLSKDALYMVWYNMIERCYNPNSNSYHNYGGRGVEVCEEWKKDKNTFFKWAKENGWNDKLQLDKDLKGSGFLYSPESCSFVIPLVNLNSRRNSVKISYAGELLSLSELASKIGLPYNLVKDRYYKGWSIEKIITPIVDCRKSIKCITTGKIFPSISIAARLMGIDGRGISDVCIGKRHTVQNHKFIYFNNKKTTHGISYSFGHIN
jgi:hypothetical protein